MSQQLSSVLSVSLPSSISNGQAIEVSDDPSVTLSVDLSANQSEVLFAIALAKTEDVLKTSDPVIALGKTGLSVEALAKTDTGPVALVGEKVELCMLQESFFQDYHRMFSPTVRSMLRLTQHATLEQTCDYLSSRIALMRAGQILFFCIFDNADQKLIGAFEIRDPHYEFGQLGVWINENYWGGGRYQEALELALSFYFSHSAAQSVNALIDVTNIRSLKAHQKYGFVIVGECIRAENGVDFVMYRLECSRKKVA